MGKCPSISGTRPTSLSFDDNLLLSTVPYTSFSQSTRLLILFVLVMECQRHRNLGSVGSHVPVLMTWKVRSKVVHLERGQSGSDSFSSGPFAPHTTPLSWPWAKRRNCVSAYQVRGVFGYHHIQFSIIQFSMLFLLLGREIEMKRDQDMM